MPAASRPEWTVAARGSQPSKRGASSGELAAMRFTDDFGGLRHFVGAGGAAVGLAGVAALIGGGAALAGADRGAVGRGGHCLGRAAVVHEGAELGIREQ